ncbi:MAG: hypothetical protein HFI63_10530 [Lachnospiraceae bacterium]|nr:hypothetical protein [Lachnospiraceae bacterium]
MNHKLWKLYLKIKKKRELIGVSYDCMGNYLYCGNNHCHPDIERLPTTGQKDLSSVGVFFL